MSVFKNLIDGVWVDGPTSIENVNPSDLTDVVGVYAQANAEQASQAVDRASEASLVWANSGIQSRFDALDAIGSEILARKEELGRLLSREEGKSLVEGMGEVTRAGQIFKFFAGETLRLRGELVPSVRTNVEVQVTREPVGVVGVITPWNFPIAIPAWKIAPAIAFGNSVVFKPATQVLGSAWALSEIISRSGLPDGVFNLVMGSAADVGYEILNNDKIRAVSFTGSVATGRRVSAICSARGAKFQTEMGGKNPLIVLNDAEIKTAVSCAINGAYFSTGQRCTASSRLIVEDGIHDQFVDAMIEEIGKIKVGNPLNNNTHVGPVIDQTQLDQDLEYIRIGQEEGATLRCGGERLALETEGYFLSPALFTDTDNGMRINQEEIFGPVASVIRVADFDEAVDVANDSVFGLCAGICTTSLRNANLFKQRSRAGMVMVNLPTAGVDYHVPFGGTKESSYGAREQGSHAAEFYTSVKTTYLQF